MWVSSDYSDDDVSSEYSDDDEIKGDPSGAIDSYKEFGYHGKRLWYRAGDYQKHKLKSNFYSHNHNTLEFLQDFLQNYMDDYQPETALPLHNPNINFSGSRNKLHPLPETVLKDLETAYFNDKYGRVEEVTIIKYLFVDNNFIHRFNKYLRPDAFYYYIRKVYEQSRDCFLRIVNCLRPDVYTWIPYVEYVVYMSRLGWIKKENQWDMITILLENGFDVNTRIDDRKGRCRSIIWNACDTGEFEIVKSLCEKYSAKLDLEYFIKYHYDLYKKEKENVQNLILYQNISDILIRNFDIDTLRGESESGDKIEDSVDIQEFISRFEVKLDEELKRRKLQNIRGLLLISYKRRLDLHEDDLRYISSFF